MKSPMTRLGTSVVAVFVLAALTVGYFAFRSPGASDPNAPIKIAFIGPLTGSSEAIGVPIKQSIELAIAELSATNPRVSFLAVDDECDAKKASIALQKLVDVDQVRFVIGGVCHEESIALGRIAQANRVVLISPASDAAAYSDIGEYVFRNTQPDTQGGELLAREIASKFKMLGIMTERGEEAQAYHDAFGDAFVAAGGTIVDDEDYAPGTTDFAAQIARLKRTTPKAEALFLNMRNDKSTHAFLDAFRAAKWKIPLYGYPTVAGKAIELPYTKLLEGLIVASAPNLDMTQASAQTFVAAYKAKYGKFDGIDAYNAAGYEAVQLYGQGIASGALTASAMVAYLDGVNAFAGIQGTYSFDERGDMVGVPFKIQKVKNGKLE